LDLARFLCLPFKIVEEGIRFLKDERCIEVTGGEIIGRVSYKYTLTDLGRRRAQDAMRMCSYVGPAPVPLEDYVEQTYRQAVTGISVTPETLRASFGHLVISDDLFTAIGPAIVSWTAVCSYGAPGNVKASGGIFLVDDFGRQLCSPKELLNRWILPLEDRHDFLSLASGQKFQVPFEQLTIFSTNLDPKDLVDEAFLRRMRHKVEIPAP